MKLLSGVLCAALMILGAAELARLLTFRGKRSLTRGPFTLVVTAESPEECECRLRAALDRMRWLDVKGPCRLLCVNETGDPEIDGICRRMSARCPCLRVCKKGELEYNIETAGT